MSALLELERVCAGYGRARVLFDLDLDLDPGRVLALIGRNGAGKSTTLKTIMGLVPPASGAIRLDGAPLSGLAPWRIARAGIGYVPESRRIFTGLTVRENLEIGRRPPRPDAPEWTPESLYRLFPNLAALEDRPAGRISGGEQQMLTLARTLMGNPRLLLLDEPSEGLAPVIVDAMADAITELKTAGLAILLSEQNLRLAGRIADDAALIEGGRLRHRAGMASLLADQAALDRWLAV